jgi:NitT/TauT family transport system ATP-binding protein
MATEARPNAAEMATERERPLIEVRGLSKRYRSTRGEDVLALTNIDLELMPGEFVSVVGPSGCGKSTLLKILAGLLPQSEGEALLSGTPIVGPRPDIGIVFQNPVLLPWKTVFENAMLPVDILHLDRGLHRERALELLRLVGLDGFEDKYPFELSGGMQQRTAIVRALVHDPAILLMDEPFGALDAMTREQMNVELLKIWRESKKTVFFITHSIPEAVFLSDTVFVMSSRPGRIVRTIEVDLSRPRTLSVLGEPHFGRLTAEIRTLFEAGAT